MEKEKIKSGIAALDEVIQGIRLGDNVVWQVDNLSEYTYFARPFLDQALSDHRRCVYIRFAQHPPILERQEGLTIIEVQPHAGFDAFSAEVHSLIEAQGRETFYVFDCLSELVVEWATDELLANFFQVTCPFLFELDTVAYFALIRGQHAHSAVARIRDTTQLLIDIYHAEGSMYMHPLKVWDRYSPRMFLPHLMSGKVWLPVFYSGDAAAVSATGSKKPLHNKEKSTAPWKSVYRKLVQYDELGTCGEDNKSEIAALKQELCRMMLGVHPEFGRLSDMYFSLPDLFYIRDRIIGSGRIGGKAAG
ncbi:MAG: phosphoenolpyruvate synthase, partial [Smithellaceae bacterium]|nr:phosphoenolpyruvate synthase [Smithellaceae bacterium]